MCVVRRHRPEVIWRHRHRHHQRAVTSRRRSFRSEVWSQSAVTCTAQRVRCRSTRRLRLDSITTARHTLRDWGQSLTTTHNDDTPHLAHSSKYRQVLAARIMLLGNLFTRSVALVSSEMLIHVGRIKWTCISRKNIYGVLFSSAWGQIEECLLNHYITVTRTQ